MKTNDLMWLAGWLEGEGTFLKSGHYPRICGDSTDRDVVEKIAVLLDSKMYTRKPNGTTHRKAVYCFRLGKHRGVELMQRLLFFMGARRQLQIVDCMMDYYWRVGSLRGWAALKGSSGLNKERRRQWYRDYYQKRVHPVEMMQVGK